MNETYDVWGVGVIEMSRSVTSLVWPLLYFRFRLHRWRLEKEEERRIRITHAPRPSNSIYKSHLFSCSAACRLAAATSPRTWEHLFFMVWSPWLSSLPSSSLQAKIYPLMIISTVTIWENNDYTAVTNCCQAELATNRAKSLGAASWMLAAVKLPLAHSLTTSSWTWKDYASMIITV